MSLQSAQDGGRDSGATCRRRIVLACAAVLNEFANPIGLPPEHPSLVDWVQCIDEHLGACNRQPHRNSPFAEAAQEVEFRHTGKARLDHPSRSIGRIVPGLAHNACSALDLMLSQIRHFPAVLLVADLPSGRCNLRQEPLRSIACPAHGGMSAAHSVQNAEWERNWMPTRHGAHSFCRRCHFVWNTSLATGIAVMALGQPA